MHFCIDPHDKTSDVHFTRDRMSLIEVRRTRLGLGQRLLFNPGGRSDPKIELAATGAILQALDAFGWPVVQRVPK